MPRRREYVSFLSGSHGRRELAAFDRRRRPSRLILPALALSVLGVAVWWWAFRVPLSDTEEVLTLDDASVPAVIHPTENEGLPFSDEPTVACIDEAVDWTTFQGTVTRTGCTSARTITTPRILWQEQIGVQGWLNSPIITGGMMFVGSAGSAQGQQDRHDGIYALDLSTGERAWFYGTDLDVNGLSVAENTVIATGDEGKVWALAMATGLPIWIDDLESPTFGSPLTVGGIVVVGDLGGRVTAYSIRDGTRQWQHTLNGPIRGGAVSDGEIIVVNSEHRDVLAVTLAGAELWRVTVRSSEPRSDNTRLWAAPTIVGDVIVLGLLRDDIYIEPALIALDKADGSLVWEAQDSANITSEWANVRSSPAVVDGALVYGQPYSSLMIALDPADGRTLWSAELSPWPGEEGLYCSHHWPSPAIVGDQAIIARQDGAVYAVSLATQRVVWSIYIGTSDSGGRFPEEFAPGFCDAPPEGFAAIQASPAVAPDGTIVIGTLDGRIVAIGDRDW